MILSRVSGKSLVPVPYTRTGVPSFIRKGPVSLAVGFSFSPTLRYLVQ
uniref:Uncharacterized protein n=1 Tax=Anguilla anguilla TaxID=7936 RepID=A0A0E9QLN2_ANGAN